jgi:6-phosphofructokinase 1
MLASSRGSQDIGMMVDFLLEKKVDILFTLGGDGTQRGAERISQVMFAVAISNANVFSRS